MRALMRSDFVRLPEIATGRASRSQKVFAFVQPNYLGLFLYRLAHYFQLRRWYTLSSLLATFNVYLTRMEIPPATTIGAGCLIGHAPAVLCGRIGERFTFYGWGGCGGGFSSEDIGGGPGFPVIGDDVVFAIRATVLGAVHIGNGAHLGPTCTVTRNVPAGATVVGPLSRVAGGAPDAPEQAVKP